MNDVLVVIGFNVLFFGMLFVMSWMGDKAIEEHYG